MISNITQDSGIHTMSSRRDSAYSDSALPMYHSPNALQHRTNSDYSSSANYIYHKHFTDQLDHMSNGVKNIDFTTQHTDGRSSQNFLHSPYNNCESTHTVNSCDINRRQCGSQHESNRLSCCSQRCYLVDPGGGENFTCQKMQKETCCTSLHHTRCSCMNQVSGRNYYKNG